MSSWSKERFKSDKILKNFAFFGKILHFWEIFGKFWGKFCIFSEILHFWKKFFSKFCHF